MIPQLCFITDPAAPQDVLSQAVAAAEGGAGWVQLRDKSLPDDLFAALGRQLIAALEPLGAQLIVNDRVEVAMAIGAAGLHIGQGDGDPAQIRARIGADMVLGLSVESPAHLAHLPEGVDYLGVGPIRATGSKPDHAPPIGVAGFADIAARTALPCLAIGGVGASDAAALKAAGGAGLAVISAISRAPDMKAAAQSLCQAWSRA